MSSAIASWVALKVIVTQSCNDLLSISLNSCLFYFILFLFRIANGLLVRTYYVADEYWQSLEPAHFKVFGNGYLTWEWNLGLRSSLLPSFIMYIYSKLSKTGFDSNWMLINCPKLFMSFLGFICDILLYKWAKNIHESSSKWIFYSYISNWFLFYCIPRTLSNTFELYLHIIIIYLYPWDYKKCTIPFNTQIRNILYMFFIFTAVFVRPTSLPLFILVLFHFINVNDKTSFILQFCWSFLFSFAMNFYVDSIFYGFYTLTPLNFVKFNFVYNISGFYGTQPWYWYFVVGLPAIMGIHMLGVIIEFRNAKFIISLLLFLYILMLSLFPHKEFRFLLPMIPYLSYVAGKFYHSLHVGNYSCMKFYFPNTWIVIKNVLLALIVILHLNLAIYFSVIHQRGTMDVMTYIGTKYKSNPKISVLFLMPCHSTPFYSHIHYNIPLKFLRCDPYLPGTLYDKNATNEYDTLLKQPDIIYNLTTIQDAHYSHIFFYSTIYDLVRPHLHKMNYTLCHGFFHTHIPYDDIGRYIMCYCKEKKI